MSDDTLLLDERHQIGANHPPPDPVGDVEAIDPFFAILAEVALRDICWCMRRCNPMFARGDRLKGEPGSIRDLWLWAMRPHIPTDTLAQIALLHPKTVVSYTRRLTEAAKTDDELNAFMEMIADRTEPLPGILQCAPAAMIRIALARIKKAVDKLAAPIVSPPQRQVSDSARSVAAAIHADIMARRAQAKAEYAARRPELNENWRAFKNAPAGDVV